MEENAAKKSSGLGITAMVLGIVGLCFSCLIIGGIVGIVGMVFSIIALFEKGKNKGFAITGIICNSLAVLIMMVVISFAYGPESNSDSNSASSVAEETTTTPQTTAAVKPEKTINDIKDDGTIDVDISDCHIKYIKHEIVKNLSGDECIAVYYEFTNNSDKNKSFDYTVSDKAFQNGVELESSLFHVNDESKASGLEIKPEITITVCSVFVLRDEESDVELEIDEWLSADDETEDEMVLSVK